VAQPSRVPPAPVGPIARVVAPAATEVGRTKKPGLLGDPARTGGRSRGTPGPDAGYALTLVAHTHDELQLTAGEDRHDVEVAIALLAARRAALVGRAPCRDDVAVAADLFGLRGRTSPAIVEDRRRWMAGLAHSYVLQRRFVDHVSAAALAQRPGSVTPFVQTPQPAPGRPS
jgi:hypothetical protein